MHHGTHYEVAELCEIKVIFHIDMLLRLTGTGSHFRVTLDLSCVISFSFMFPLSSFWLVHLVPPMLFSKKYKYVTSYIQDAWSSFLVALLAMWEPYLFGMVITYHVKTLYLSMCNFCIYLVFCFNCDRQSGHFYLDPYCSSFFRMLVVFHVRVSVRSSHLIAIDKDFGLYICILISKPQIWIVFDAYWFEQVILWWLSAQSGYGLTCCRTFQNLCLSSWRYGHRLLFPSIEMRMWSAGQGMCKKQYRPCLNSCLGRFVNRNSIWYLRSNLCSWFCVSSSN